MWSLYVSLITNSCRLLGYNGLLAQVVLVKWVQEASSFIGMSKWKQVVVPQTALFPKFYNLHKSLYRKILNVSWCIECTYTDVKHVSEIINFCFHTAINLYSYWTKIRTSDYNISDSITKHLTQIYEENTLIWQFLYTAHFKYLID